MNLTRAIFYAFLSVIPLAANASEPEAQHASERMEMHYRAIYDGATCARRDIADQWYLKCSPDDSTVGGVYLVLTEEKLVPVNGKAKQHAEKIGSTTGLQFIEWRDVFPDKIPDVVSILEAFGR